MENQKQSSKETQAKTETLTKGYQDLTEKYRLPSHRRQRFTIMTIIANAMGCDLSDLPECVEILESLKK